MNSFRKSRGMYCSIGALLLLQACSVGKSYKEIDPEGAQRDVRQNNGYYALKSVLPGKSKVVFRSDGSPRPVAFALCTRADSCEQSEDLGTVGNSGHGVVYPWIAKMTNKANRIANQKPYLMQHMTPDQTVRVRGVGKWLDSRALITVSGSCGPLETVLTPVEGRAYVVEFKWIDDDCKQLVYDATNPDALVLLSESYSD